VAFDGSTRERGVPALEVRSAERREVDALARIWYDGWQDAHAELLPAELAQLRTLESFRDRLQAALHDVRVVGAGGEPDGFSMTKEDELYQLYVSATSRGGAVAAALLADAEDRIARSGVRTAWLACAIGNMRAARFYEKHGWQRAGVVIHHADTSDGPFALEVWRYEKTLPRRLVP
jgi:GNAT superfamily N-acetyltransferase